MTNEPNFMSQSEPSAPKVIIMYGKMRTDVSILSGITGASVTPEERISINKRNMKSPAISPLIKDTISNQDINRLITKKYQILLPNLSKFPPGFK